MSNIAIYTDSTADFSKKWLEDNDVKCISLTYSIDGEEFEDNTEAESIKEFYDKIRDGKMPKTSAAGVQSFLTAFEHELKEGKDVFYTGLSGKLSVTYNNACMARDELNKKYRDDFKKYFTTATVPFYWNGLEPEKGKPRFDKNSEKIYRRPAPELCVEYCEENGINPKLHCLVYDKFLPDWLPTQDMKEMEKYYEGTNQANSRTL